MTTWALLAPGPSANRQQAQQVRASGIPLGVISSAFPLARWADFIAATDSAWWRSYPDAKHLPGRKFSIHAVPGVEKIRVPGWVSCNSGVLGLECAKRLGATRILLLGFDMHGTHYFGEYTNGLSNTRPEKRRMHLSQYKTWRKRNPGIEVINCTSGSVLTCFKTASMDEYLQDGGGSVLRIDR